MTFVVGFAAGSAISSDAGTEISSWVKSSNGQQVFMALPGCGLLSIVGHPAVGAMVK